MKKQLMILGSKGSGKTTFAVKLAEKLSKKGKVIIVSLDKFDCFESYLNGNGGKSIGEILMQAVIERDDILKSLSTTNNENICYLTFGFGDYEGKFSKFAEQNILDFFIQVKHLCDYVIVDGVSRCGFSPLEKTAIDISDELYILYGNDPKGLIYYKALESYEEVTPIDKEKIYIQNKSNKDRDYISVKMEDYKFPYSEELHRQYLYLELMNKLSKKDEWNKKINTLLEEREYIEKRKEEKSLINIKMPIKKEKQQKEFKIKKKEKEKTKPQKQKKKKTTSALSIFRAKKEEF